MGARQAGVSLMGLIIGLFIFIFAALLGFKIIPPVLEYRTIQAGLEAIGREKQSATVAEIRRSFDARAQIDDISSVKGEDLEVTKEAGEVVIKAAWRKEVPLFANLGMYLDFAASSKPE